MKNIPEQQFFPFSSWNLFGTIPTIRSEYQIIVYSYGDTHVHPPKRIQEIPNLMKKTAWVNDANLYTIIQEFGASYKKNDANFPIYKQLLEDNYLDNPLTYLLIKTTYDPMKRWRGEKSKIEHIKMFTNVYEY